MTTHTLQLAFAALVEAPYEVARVEIETSADTISVRYECDMMRPLDTDRVPVLDPPAGEFTWRAQGWASEEMTRSARGV